MKTTGYIVNGVYHKGKIDPVLLRHDTQPMFKGWNHDMQRRDHARDILQPYDRSGQPNQTFIEQYRDESIDYGFIEGDNGED